MKIALLCRQIAWAHWVQKQYPKLVDVFTEVDEELLAYDFLFITPSYAIDTDYYHILELWYEAINNEIERTNIQRLGMLGLIPHNSPNYLHVLNPPSDLEIWLRKAIPAAEMRDEKYLFPKLADEDILLPLSRILLSHADKALHVRTENFKSILDEFEEELAWGTEINYLLKGEPIRAAAVEIQKIQEIVTQRAPFLSLLPHYPAFQKSFQTLVFHWEKLIGPQMRIPEIDLSEHARQFAEIITEITSFYRMEKRFRTK